MGLVYSQCCNQVIDTSLYYTAKPLLKLEQARLEQEKKTENDNVKKVETQAKKVEEQSDSTNIDNQADKLLDISA
ncbi:hypothetical protein OLP40_04475 [Campylobacter jejuni]|nr:hypothetical protein C414_000020035 [Campylobacter jejuni subsp. jejuni 414]MCW1333548.1 hypothetical protein [Campylobacter jejuni]MCW1359066.1 hypothetical protein [Campylobacter jejuni]HDZ4932649.1 hypothetical protein [Campylobacter jejuni]HDZ4936864.1 hypothetical protein [Campylobacter jejuni]